MEQQQNTRSSFNQSSSNASLIWFLLVDSATGQIYKGTTADAVSLFPHSVIVQFRDAVKAKYTNVLSTVDSGSLLVYKNKAAFEKRNAALDEEKEQPLMSSYPVTGLGLSEEEAIIVAVSSSQQQSNSTQQFAYSFAAPSDTNQQQLLQVNLSHKINQISESLTNLLRLSDGEKGKKTVFSAQDSLEQLNPPNENVLKLEVKGVNNVPDFLYTEQIYHDLKDIGVEMPVDKINKMDPTIVMIGVSGCGKTRTCYDLCRSEMCLYFDCSVDDDMNALYSELDVIKPRFKDNDSQQLFESYSESGIRCLIAARLFVLKNIMESNTQLTPFEWLCIQRSRRTNDLFNTIFRTLFHEEFAVSYNIYVRLKQQFKEVRLIFDESQRLLNILEKQYRSNKSDRRQITNGGNCEYPRSLFTFLTGFIIQSKFKSIWCGTQMRIQNMELFYSAAGGKPYPIHIFTKFNYLTESHISDLLRKWVDISQINDSLLEYISYILQGRPRLLMMFLYKLRLSNNVAKSIDEYVREMTTNQGNENFSFYYFWKDRISWVIRPLLAEKTTEIWKQKELVAQCLLKLCISFLTGRRGSIPFDSTLDILSTNLVMVSQIAYNWEAVMIEPIVVTAGLNYLSSLDPYIFINYLSKDLFTPLIPGNMTAQERGNLLEFIVSIRFFSCWWKEKELSELLPSWACEIDIPGPVGIVDCRTGTFKNQNPFIDQLQDRKYPYLVFPPTSAGPDLRYSIFSCSLKSTSTANSASSMFVTTTESKKNIATSTIADWYKSNSELNGKCIQACNTLQLKFVHLLFEMPFSAPSTRESPMSGKMDNGDYFLRINLDSTFARHFFGQVFVEQYKQFVMGTISKFKTGNQNY